MKNKGFHITIAFICLILGLMLTVQFKSIRKISSAGIDKMRAEDLQSALISVKMLAGLTAVQGQGIIITLDDSKNPKEVDELNENLYVIHDSDILLVINELRASGAEAISINEQRVISTSEIRCAGPVLSINNVRTAAPFVIKAVGNSTDMENALRMRDGVVDVLQQWGIEIDISKQSNIVIPEFSGTVTFKYCTPREGGKK